MNSKTGNTVLRFCVFISALVIFFCSAMSAWAADVINENIVNDSAPMQGELKDLYFGEALFYAYQDEYFDAISRLDTELAQYYGLDEPVLNSLYVHINHAEFSVGDFELYYRMHDRAGRAIKAVIEGNVEESVRNEAIYRLAKIYYQKQQPLIALETIEKLQGRLPEKIRYEEPFLRAQIYMATGKFSEAINLLKNIEGEESLKGYAGYNLGVALFQNGNEQEGIAQLDKVGLIQSSEEKVQAMRDKANLVLGFRLLESQQHAQAKQYLQRVRLKGPFSNKALLGTGWAAAAVGEFDRALVPWSMLSTRDVTNKSVQEVLLGVPYAYGKLNIYGKAAILYGQALESYSKEIERLDASIASIRQGAFLKAVIREELKKDKHWLIHLRELPDTPETYYLTQMMASHDFQELLKNYFDLAELERRLEYWAGYIDAYEEIIKIRETYYEPLLPEIENQFRSLDSKMKLRIEQRDKLDKRLKKMLVSPRPDFLMTVDERIVYQQLLDMESVLAKQGINDEKVQQRIARLKGVITWNINLEYHDRFTKATEHLRELDAHVEKLKAIYNSFVRTRQAATQSYKGYDKQLTRLRIKIRDAQGKIKVVMARQGHMIEVMAITELEQRRARLEEYQVKARFAMAESYDRATRAKQEAELANEASKAQEAAQNGRGSGQEQAEQQQLQPGAEDNSGSELRENKPGNAEPQQRPQPEPQPQPQPGKQSQTESTAP
ncbi:MAG: tetratricopeptide repeat protein [Gammaproteobacteria bacterium]|nr:tetratricopeptide repeat protein [Gammaproteobacteria bacterium]